MTERRDLPRPTSPEGCTASWGAIVVGAIVFWGVVALAVFK